MHIGYYLPKSCKVFGVDMVIVTFCANGSKIDAIIGGGASESVGSIAAQAFRGGRVAVICDPAVRDLYGAAVVSRLTDSGFLTDLISLRGGENNKTLESVSYIYERLYTLGMTRADGIISLGGGVTGDIVGFAAATYLRGLPYISVPTTLIAQTDSAYGGKTGVDFHHGKNYIGCFYPPKAVVCDTDYLASLPMRERLSGMGEVIKYGAIADRALIDSVISHGINVDYSALVPRCADIKRIYVEADPFDTGERHMLNFGHTFGHAYEAASDYRLSHGQAVAYGMLAASRLSEILGYCKGRVYDKIFQACVSVGMDVDWQTSLSEALKLISRDKKSDGRHIDMVLLTDVAKPIRVPVSVEAVLAAMEKTEC